MKLFFSDYRFEEDRKSNKKAYLNKQHTAKSGGHRSLRDTLGAIR
jgi:hypothetical protein